MQELQAAFSAQYPDMAVFARGRRGAAALLAVAPGRLAIKIVGTVPSEHLVALLTQAREAGHIASDQFCALVDLTQFTGAIDWDEIKKISAVMPKGDSRTNKNAYVVRDSFLAMVAKITSVLFPKTECAAFSHEVDAKQWLGWA
jgi:hypothetical protein